MPGSFRKLLGAAATIAFTALAISGSATVRDESLDDLYDELLTLIYNQREISANLTELVCPKVSRSIMSDMMIGRRIGYQNYESTLRPVGSEAWTVYAFGSDILRSKTLFIEMDETDSCLAVFRHRSNV